MYWTCDAFMMIYIFGLKRYTNGEKLIPFLFSLTNIMVVAIRIIKKVMPEYRNPTSSMPLNLYVK